VKRRLFNAGAVVSLVLCLLATALWTRSYWSADMVTPSFIATAVSKEGSLQFTLITDAEWIAWHEVNWYWYSGRDAESWYTIPWVRGPEHLVRFDYAIQQEMQLDGSVASTWQQVVFPHWVLVVIFLLLPMAWVATLKRRRALTCPACGYDLRGTPESPSGGGSETPSKTCPECGATSGAAA
jgi:hypothetical protein